MFTGVSDRPARNRAVRRLFFVFAAGTVYYLFVRLTGITLFCPVQKVTGLACPGCGISHFFMDLAEFRFADAFLENVAVASLIPVWGLSVAAVYIKNGAAGVKSSRFLNALAWVSVAILAVFGVVRNLPGCAFLLPSYLR